MAPLTIEDELAREADIASAFRDERSEDGLDEYSRARLAFLRQHPEGALGELEKVRDVDATAAAFYLRLLVRTGARAARDVEGQLDDLVQQNPQLIGPKLQRGVVAIEAGDLEHAARLADELIGRCPDSWECRLLLAAVCQVSKRPGEAVQALREYRGLGGPMTEEVLHQELLEAVLARDGAAVREAYRLRQSASGRRALEWVPWLLLPSWTLWPIVVAVGVFSSSSDVWGRLFLSALLLVYWGIVQHTLRLRWTRTAMALGLVSLLWVFHFLDERLWAVSIVGTLILVGALVLRGRADSPRAVRPTPIRTAVLMLCVLLLILVVWGISQLGLDWLSGPPVR